MNPTVPVYFTKDQLEALDDFLGACRNQVDDQYYKVRTNMRDTDDEYHDSIGVSDIVDMSGETHCWSIVSHAGWNEEIPVLDEAISVVAQGLADARRLAKKKVVA